MEGFLPLLIFIVLAVAAYLWLKRQKKPDLSVLPPRFIVADIETTGLNPDKHEIIEIAAVMVNRDSDRHDYWRAVVKPSKKVPRKISEITGITQDMVDAEGQPLEKVIEDFLAFVGDHRLVFFNADFDMAFLDRAALKLGRRISNRVSCALKMMRRAYPGLKSYKLSALATAGKLDSKGMHRALKDCEMTITVYAAAATKLQRID